MAPIELTLLVVGIPLFLSMLAVVAIATGKVVSMDGDEDSLRWEQLNEQINRQRIIPFPERGMRKPLDVTVISLPSREFGASEWIGKESYQDYQESSGGRDGF